jgi:nucleotide-binding universal stress UspA family protein
MLETILVAVDASDQKHAVLLHAAEISRRFGAKLHVVSVYDLSQFSEVKAAELVPEIFDTLEAETKKLLEGARQLLDAWGIVSQSHFVQGSVVEQIVLLARQLNADLVVMGHRYVSGLRRLLEHSAAKSLIDESPCSVMIIRESEAVAS